jgi:hypothetical protein
VIAGLNRKAADERNKGVLFTEIDAPFPKFAFATKRGVNKRERRSCGQKSRTRKESVVPPLPHPGDLFRPISRSNVRRSFARKIPQR